jgi:hypothetical protein
MAVVGNQMEIHVQNDGMCRVISGVARKTFTSTSEAVGLVLLGMNQGSLSSAVKWVDFLASKGLAFGSTNKDTFTIMVLPEQERVVQYHRNDTKRELKATFPPMVMAVRMSDQTLRKAMFFMLKAGSEKKLSVTSAEGTLAVFPYGNVYDHGGVCWGNTSVRDIHHPSEVEGAFFGSAFNGDLFYPSYWGGSEGNLPGVVERCDGELPAPRSDRYTKTIVQVVQEIGR